MSHRIKVTVTGYYEVDEKVALENYEGATTAAQVAAVDQRGYDTNQVAAAEVIEWCDGEVEVKVEAADAHPRRPDLDVGDWLVSITPTGFTVARSDFWEPQVTEPLFERLKQQTEADIAEANADEDAGTFGPDIAVAVADEDGEVGFTEGGIEFHTPHAQAHEAVALKEHDHLHGDGPGQHTHDGWTPDQVQARMKRDGFCGAEDNGGYCMSLATSCLRHPHDCGMVGCTEVLAHTHPTL